MNKAVRSRLENIVTAMKMSSAAGRWQAVAGDSRVSVYEGVYVYHTSASGLSHGTSLGNARTWVASKGTGEMESLFCVEVGEEVAGPMAINYYSPRHQYLAQEISLDKPRREEKLKARTPLPPISHGEFHFHPAYQQRSMTLVGSIDVLETLFVPRSEKFDDATAIYHVVRLSNSSIQKRRVTVLGALHLPGKTERDVEGRFDQSSSTLIAWNRSKKEWVRIFGVTPAADAYAITLNIEETYYPSGPQDSHANAVGESFGALEKTVELEPGEAQVISFLTVFSHNGQEEACDLYRRYSDYEQAFAETVDFYNIYLSSSIVITPDLILNQGAQWSKANMLRVLHRYPFPKKDNVGFTNDPGRGSNLVVRDASWFTIGCDYLSPEVSRELLETIAGLQQESGKIVEYWNGIDGSTNDYELNINDNTPLFICAVAHHVLCTGDMEFARRLYPVVEKAARYILSQRDDRGLVFCTASGTGVYGIAGWRNIIEDRTISGAVTEINSECFAALYATGMIARALGNQNTADEFVKAATGLRAAINNHLKNPTNGLYYLTSNIHGVDETTVTADLVFPMIFKVADDETTGLIMQRLLMPDFNTAAGLRTLSSKNPLYRPDSYVGLLGGVWPGVTWWFALACARYDSSLIVDALVSSYQHYLRNPGTYNTVPGQFSEWFDGETLINRGMRLSPWEPPRFLWAVLEGAMGLGIQIPAPKPEGNGELHKLRAGTIEALRSQEQISPVVPEKWQWFALRNVPMGGSRLSYFAVRLKSENGGKNAHTELTLFGVGKFESPHPIRFFKTDASEELYSLATDVAALAFADEVGKKEGTILLLLGSMTDEARIAPIETGRLFEPNSNYRGRIYLVERGEWDDLDTRSGRDLSQFAAQVEAGQFRLYEFHKI
jgi:hypothetical protein